MTPRALRPSRITLLTVALVLIAAPGASCRGDTTGTSPVFTSDAASSHLREARAVGPRSPADAPLERAVGLALGLPRPVGLALVERDDDIVRFRATQAFNRLTDFFDRELPGHRRTDGPDGTKYEPAARDGPVVYLLPTHDHGVDIVYLRGDIDLSALDIPGFDSPDAAPWRGGRRSSDRSPYRQGPTVPAELADRRPGGSYDRGDGERSLRPTPARARDGRPLPFYGTQRIESPPP